MKSGVLTSCDAAEGEVGSDKGTVATVPPVVAAAAAGVADITTPGKEEGGLAIGRKHRRKNGGADPMLPVLCYRTQGGGTPALNLPAQRHAVPVTFLKRGRAAFRGRSFFPSRAVWRVPLFASGCLAV